MKYKRLSQEELQELEPEFIHFLATHQVTADEWVNMKANDMERVEALIDTFSDMVFEKALSNIQYVEHLTRQDWMIFHCMEDKLKLAAIQLSDETALDLTDPDFFKHWEAAPDSTGITVYSKEQPYAEQREKVIFQLLENGCTITDATHFNLLMAQQG